MAYTKTIWTEITAITTTVLNKIEDGIEAAHNAIASISLDWSSITGKPSTFTPSTHSHAIADVTSLQTSLDGKASTSHNHDTVYLGITSKASDSDKLNGQLASYYATASHNHDTAYLGKTAQAADSLKLNGQLASYYALASHNHDTAYLGKTAQAADSNKISGKKVFVQTTQPTATATGDVWISY